MFRQLQDKACQGFNAGQSALKAAPIVLTECLGHHIPKTRSEEIAFVRVADAADIMMMTKPL